MSYVLVVEDDPELRDVVAMVLEDSGYTVETANNGAEALAKIDQSPPALVVTDLRMPVMDGWELVQACRQRPDCRHLPVVVMSAAHRAPAAQTLQAQAFVPKPFEIDELLSTVERVL